MGVWNSLRHIAGKKNRRLKVKSHLREHRKPRDLRMEKFEDRVLLTIDPVADPTYRVDSAGHGYFVDPGWDSQAQPDVDPSLAAGAPARYPLVDTFKLHSNPGASKVVYLDFDGHTTTGTAWNALWSMDPIVTPAYDFDGNVGSFSNAELQFVQDVWDLVAEDYLPFDVDVTTEDPGVEALRNTGGGDTQWGIRVVIGPDQANTGAGGIAYISSFSWDSDTPCFVFNQGFKGVAEAASHEAGHTVGLLHDGDATQGYYPGHGTGPTGWAPIMGVGYYEELVQWSKGEYPGANNTEDDLAIITANNGFGYRSDDHGDTRATASQMLAGGSAIGQRGIIERTGDVDYFSFQTLAGAVTLNIDPFYRSPNLDILATVYNSAGTVIATNNPAGALNASFNLTLPAGTYYLSIDGTGKPAGADPGYSDYASLGYYSISGTVVPVPTSSLKLVSIIPNTGTILNDGDALQVAPRELLLRFNEGQQIDPATLGGIRILRSGGDGQFEIENGQANAANTARDVLVPYGWIGIGDRPNEVIVRFAENLPDDLYRITIVGDTTVTGVADNAPPLKNTLGAPFQFDLNLSDGVDQSFDFDLQLGPQVVAVVPQPITRSGSALSQSRTTIEVYFNEDTLDQAAATNRNFYQLFVTHDSATPADDGPLSDGAPILPASVTYDPATKKAVLTFDQDLALYGTGAFRLRIGKAYQQVQTEFRLAAVDAGNSFYTATDVHTLGGALAPVFGDGSGPQSLIIGGSVDPFPLDFTLEWPGAIDEPGHRDLPNYPALAIEDHFGGESAPDGGAGVMSIPYYFPTGNWNLITEAQKDRAREIFALYSQYLGIDFYENPAGGIAVATGDLAIMNLQSAPGGVSGVGGMGLALMDYAEDWGASEFGGAWFTTAMHEIGHLLGYGHSYDLAPLTIMGDGSDPANPITSSEPTFPGDEDILHGRHMYRPDVIDIDMYRVELNDRGLFRAEINAERMNNSSLLDSVVTLYQEYTENGATKYRVVARNDDYYSEDAALEIYLNPGTYFVGISAAGNTEYDPENDDTGVGGTTQGDYQLRLSFSPKEVDRNDPQTFRDDLANPSHLIDTTGTLLDGDYDGVPGGQYDYWFNVAAATSTPATNHTILVDKTAVASTADGTLAHPYTEIDQALAAAKPGDIVRIVGNNFLNDNPGRGIVAVPGSQIPDGTTFTLSDGVQTLTFEFDRSGTQPPVTGRIAISYTGGPLETAAVIAGKIKAAINTAATARQMDLVADVGAAPAAGVVNIDGRTVNLVLGNGPLKNTLQDNQAYEIGLDSMNKILPDGSRLDVPRGVTVVFDAGAVVKLRGANIDAGSSAETVDRSGGSVQVLGIPGRPVYFTSFFDETVGTDRESTLTTTPREGDWGGLVFRNNLDNDFIEDYDPASGNAPRRVLEAQGIFLNYVNHADFRYGGGEVTVNGVKSAYSPVHMLEARPTVTFNTITNSADAALSGDANSFADTRFENWDPVAPFTADYERIGPQLYGNVLVATYATGKAAAPQAYANSINGVFVGIPTSHSDPIEKLEVPARFDDLDIVHVIAENLYLKGTPSGPIVTPTTTQLTRLDDYRIRTPDGDGIDDAETFSIFDGSTRAVFEFNLTSDFTARGAGSFVPGRVEIRYDRSDDPNPGDPAFTTVQMADEIVKQINWARDNRGLDVTAVNVGGGVIELHTTAPVWSLEGFGTREARIDARLQVDPGVIVKLTGSRIEAEMGAQLIAEGRPGSVEGSPGYKVVFTSLADTRYGAGGTFDTTEDTSGKTAARGDWGGLVFAPTAEGSIDQAIVAYGGGTTPIEGGFARFSPVEIRQAHVRVADTRFEFNAAGSDGDRNGRGSLSPATIFVRGAQPILVANDFLGNQGSVVSIDANSLKAWSVPDWGRSTGPISAFDQYADNYGPMVRANRFGLADDLSLSNGTNGMEVRPGTLTTDSIWDDTDIVHVLRGEIIVTNYHAVGGLRLQSSAAGSLVVKLSGANAGFTAQGRPLEIDDRIGGIVQIVGQRGRPVVLTDLADDSQGSGFDIYGRTMFDTNGNGSSQGTPGAWRSIRFDRYSHDRNVAVVNEYEPGVAGQSDTNATPASSEPLGVLAPSEQAGDDIQRLGFDVYGQVRFDDPGDVDVYQFDARPGTEIWVDIDRTTFALDTIVELIDADGNVLGWSDNSHQANSYSNKNDPDGAGLALGMDRDLYVRTDFYTTNPRDAGMRLVLPGSGSAFRTYYLRVRSVLAIGRIGDGAQFAEGQKFTIRDGAGRSVVFEFDSDNSITGNVAVAYQGLNAAQVQQAILTAVANARNTFGLDVTARASGANVVLDGERVVFLPGDTSLVNLANTSGKYEMQVRLREMQEVAGSTVQYADIRYATNGIEALGFPQHSPLLGETAESTANNDTMGAAQDLGNLMHTDRGTLSVAGYLSGRTDVDWYRMEIDFEAIQSIAGINDAGSIFSTIFDIDYADGMARPDLSIWVFDSQGRLILRNGNSNVADDQPMPTPGTELDDWNRGSLGTRDPYIGPAYLPEGNQVYYVAVTSVRATPQALSSVIGGAWSADDEANPLVRIEPIDSIARVVEEHSDTGPNSFITTNNPNVTGQQRLSLVPDEFQLGDVTFYSLTGGSLYTADPFTGALETNVSNWGGQLPGAGGYYYGDMAMRNDGRLMTVTSGPGGNFNPRYRELDTGNSNNLLMDVDTGIDIYRRDPANMANLQADPNNGATIEAMVHDYRNTDYRGRSVMIVGNVPGPDLGGGQVGITSGHNLMWLLNSNGTAVNPPNASGGARLFSNVVPMGQLFSAPTILANAASQTQPTYATWPGGVQSQDFRDGDFFTVTDSLGATQRFEFDFGLDVRMDPQGAAVFRDGQQFSLVNSVNGQTYRFEFNSGPVIVLPATATSALDGVVVTVYGTAPGGGNAQVSFEFDNNNTLNDPTNHVRVSFLNGQTGSTLANTLFGVINAQNAAFTVLASAVGNRVSLVNDRLNTPPAVTFDPTGLVQIQGNDSWTGGYTEIKYEETWTSQQLGQQIESVVDASQAGIFPATDRIDASYAFRATDTANPNSPGDRLTFVNASSISGNAVTNAPNFTGPLTYVTGAPGIVSGNAIRVGAGYTAQQMAAAIAGAINGAPFLVGGNAVGATVELTEAAAANPVNLGGASQLSFAGEGVGGDITGMAYLNVPGIGYRLFAVSNTGGLYYITNETSANAGGGSWGFVPVNPQNAYAYFTRVAGGGPQLHYIGQVFDPTTGTAIQFSGLSAGPQNVEDGRFAQTLFATSRTGVVYALNTVGDLLGIFEDGTKSINPGLGAATGVAFSPIDYNLWHTTYNRWNDAGHGIYSTFDHSRVSQEAYNPLYEGDQSYYFGLDDYFGQANQAQPGAINFTTNQASDGSRVQTYNMPGGAFGAMSSGTFSLKGYSAADKPTLYFTYYAQTENTADFDGLRVFVSNDGADWTLMATNTDLNDGLLIAPAIEEPGIASTYIRQIHDGGGVWRQARIDLSQFAGRDNLRLRFDFSTASDMDIGPDPVTGVSDTGGEYLTTPPAAELHDGDTFAIDGRTFEFDLGYALLLPNAAGAQIKEDPNPLQPYGEYVTISDGSRTRTFEFTKDGANLIHPASNVAVRITSSMTTRQVADELARMINIERAAGRLDVQAYVPTDPANVNAGDAIFQGPNGNRVFLIGATGVTQGTRYTGAPLAVTIQGSPPGQITPGNVPVYVRPDMSRLEVSRLITDAVNREFRALPNQIYIAPNMTAGTLGTSSFTITGLSAIGVPTQVTFTFSTASAVNTVLGPQQVRIGLAGAATPAVIAQRIAAAINLLNSSTGWQTTATSTPEGYVQLGGPQAAYNPGTGPLRAYDVNETTIKLDEREDDARNQAQPLMHVYMHSVTAAGPLFWSDLLQGDETDKSYGSTARGNNRFFDYRRGQNNNFEGWYIDDVIIGFAERGEMITNAPANVTGFDFAGSLQPTDPIVTVGSYQLEVRHGDEYGSLLTPPDSPYKVTRLSTQANTNDRWTQAFTLQIPAASNIAHGDRFWIDDGVKRQDFVFLDQKIGGATGNAIPIYFQSAQSAGTVAGRVAAAVNQAYVQGRLSVNAAAISSSERVDLWGAVSVGGTIGGQTLRRIIFGTVEANADERFHVYAPSGSQVYEGQTFQIKDRNGKVVPFMYILKTGSQTPPAGTVPVYFDPNESQWQMSTNVRNAIQTAMAAPYSLNVQFDAANAAGGTIALMNVDTIEGIAFDTYYVTFPNAGETYFHPDTAGNPLIGDRNARREKGQLVLQSNSILYSSDWGIRVQPAARDTYPHPGSGRTMNAANELVPGVAIANNVVAYSGTGGIRFAGDTNPAGQPVGAVPFGRIVNNTIYGPKASGPAGVGVQVVNNASPTLLNNVVANLDTGIFVDAGSANAGTVIGGTAFSLTNRQNVGGSATTGSFATFVAAGAPLFVAPDKENFYPAHLSAVIDSSINSLQERQDFYNSVLQPIGIPASPIVAPQLDVFGQLRVDDPSVASPPGLGLNVFKDRGAIDRVDFYGPLGALRVTTAGSVEIPDNDAQKIDRDPADNDMIVVGRTLYQFKIQLSDGQTRIDDDTVVASALVLLQDGATLKEGTDYFFEYDKTKDSITLFPAAGVWADGSMYEIQLLPAIQDIAGNSIQANRSDGSTRYTVALAGLDFGDAPDPWAGRPGGSLAGMYPTLLEHNGARHIASNLYLGNRPNSEQNARQNATATGDPYDDGVAFQGANVGFLADDGTRTKDLTVTVSADGVLDGWIDWNRDGVWDNTPGSLEHVIAGQAVNPNAPNVFTITVPQATFPAGVSQLETFARFRVTKAGLLSDGSAMAPTGEAPDGEVEDYQIKLLAFEEDFGDAPAYADHAHTIDATTGADAARHRLGSGLVLGTVDAELDGQPTATADGDDRTDIDDEDGIDLSETFFVPNTDATVTVTASGDGILSAWVDFNRDGDWSEADEQLVFTNGGAVTLGTQTLTFHVPNTVVLPGPGEIDTAYARFRLSTVALAAPTGPAPDGEVEDYQVRIIQRPRDYGDAPETNNLYPTTNAGIPDPTDPNGVRRLTGAVHLRGTGADRYVLGNRLDYESDGLPDATATGDDQDNLDDEDGVQILSDLGNPGELRAGQGATLVVTTRTPGGFLNGWVDFGDGTGAANGWGDNQDHILQVQLNPALATSFVGGVYTFDIPIAVPLVKGTDRDTFARFRYSDPAHAAQGGEFYGPAVSDWFNPAQAEIDQVPYGEVEDYQVRLLVGTASISGIKFDDRDADGVRDQTIGNDATPIAWKPRGTSVLSGVNDAQPISRTFGFDFEFYGNRYQSFYVNENGALSLGQPVATFAGAFPQPTAIIAPFWADADARGSGSVSITQGTNERNHKFVQVDWVNLGYPTRKIDKQNTFHVYIEDDPLGDVVSFKYDALNWTDTTTGAQVGFNGGTGQGFDLLAQPKTPAELAQLVGGGSPKGIYTTRFDPATGRPLGIEQPRAGTLVYLDANHDGDFSYTDQNGNSRFDAGIDIALEPYQVTQADDPATPNVDETGRYAFTGLFPGDYEVREVADDGWVQTRPSLTFHAVAGDYKPAGDPAYTVDGKKFTLERLGDGTIWTFEFDSNGSVQPTTYLKRIAFTGSETASQMAGLAAQAINAAAIPGVSAAAVDDLVVLGGWEEVSYNADPAAPAPMQPSTAKGYGITLVDQQVVTGIDFGNYRLPKITVSDVQTQVLEGNSGLTPVQLTLHLTDSYGAPVTVNYWTSDGTNADPRYNASAGADYVAVPSGSVTFGPSGTPAGQWDSRRITYNAQQDYNYSAQGKRLVWEQFVAGDWQVFLYDETTGVTRQISAGTTDNRQVAVYGDHVVWHAKVAGESDYEIFDYHVTDPQTLAGTVTQITHDAVNDSDPKVSDRYVTWWSAESPQSQVYVYDLLAPGAPVAVSKAPIAPANSAAHTKPVVSGSYVAWTAFDGNDSEIYLFDGTKTEQITSDSGDDQAPQVDAGGRLVWSSFNGTDYDIQLYDVARPGTTQTLSTTPGNDLSPSISGENIVWQTINGTQSVIYAYDLGQAAPSAVNISGTAYYAETPQVFGDHVVWHAREPSDWEIYYYELGSGFIPTNVSNDAVFDGYPIITGKAGDGEPMIVWRSQVGTTFEVWRAVPMARERTATITLQVVGETLPELDESFFVNFSVDPALDLLGVLPPSRATVTILNDDGTMDYGDAPDSYHTTLGTNGARHLEPANPALYLGQWVDTETNGQPNATATGDDAAGTPDDEDGVRIVGALVPGAEGKIEVTVATPAGDAYLDAWIDWKGDGVFDDSDRVLFNGSRLVAAGTQTYSIGNVPADARLGPTYARFRLSSSSTPLAPTGTAADGEVEDYQVTIYGPITTPTLDPIANQTVNEDPGAQALALTGITPGTGAPQDLRIEVTSSDTTLIPIPVVSPAYTQGSSTASLVWQPAADRSGTATIGVQVRGAGANGMLGDADDVFSPTRSFTITVNAVNDAPTLNPIANPPAVEENAVTQTVNLSGITAGPGESQALRVTATSSNTTLVPNGNLAASTVAADGTATLTWKPAANQNGTATITVTAWDAGLDGIPGNADDGQFSQQFTVTVNRVNRAPTLGSISDVTVSEDDSQQTTSLTGITAGLNENQALRVTARSSNTSLIADPVASSVASGGTATLTWQPKKDQFGQATITVTAWDAGLDGIPGNGDDGKVERQFTVTVNSVNDAPTLSSIANPPAVNENAGQQTVTLTGISGGPSNEPQAVTVTATSDNQALVPNGNLAVGAVSGGSATLTWRPAADQWGTAKITVTVEDGGSLTETRSFTVTVNRVNRAPTLGSISDVTVNEDASQQTTNLAGITAGLNENQALRVTATSSNPSLIADPVPSSVAADGTATLTWQPKKDQFGQTTITVTAWDAGLDGVPGNGDDGKVERQFTVTVSSINDKPTLSSIADPPAVTENAGQQTVTLTGISGGPSNEPQAVTVTATSDNQALVPNGNLAVGAVSGGIATLTWRPAADQRGTATITVTVEDGGGLTETKSFTVTVNRKAVVAQDLGSVDFWQQTGLAPTGDGLWYVLKTVRSGKLTAEAVGAGLAGGVLELYASDLTKLGDSTAFAGNQRVETTASAAGETYYVHLKSTAGPVSLRIANLVQMAGGGVGILAAAGGAAIFGTSGDDTFDFSAATLQATVRGMRYDLTGVSEVSFAGNGGYDQVTLSGSAKKESVALWKDHGTLTGAEAGYTLAVTVSDVDKLTASGGAGDVAALHGTAGDNRLLAYAAYSTLTGDGADLRVNGFEEVTADSGGFVSTGDHAYLYGTAGVDQMESHPYDTVLMLSTGQTLEARGFRMVSGMNGGVNDIAKFYDRAAAKDTFTADPTLASMTGLASGSLAPVYYNEARNFGTVEGTASRTEDRAVLKDSDAADSFLFQAKSATQPANKAVLSGNPGTGAFTAQANNFFYVTLYGIDSPLAADQAELHGSLGNDTLAAYPASSVPDGKGKPVPSTFTGPGFSVSMTYVEDLTAYGEGGSDTAKLYDDWTRADSDTFTARAAQGADPTQGTLSGTRPNGLAYSNSAIGFRTILATAYAGSDTAELHGSAGNEALTAELGHGTVPAYGLLAPIGSSAFSLRAVGFDQMTAYGEGGADKASLYDSDSSTPDVFTSRPNSQPGLCYSEMVGGGISNGAYGFQTVTAYSKYGTGKDEAYLYGVAGVADTLTNSISVVKNSSGQIDKSKSGINATLLGKIDATQVYSTQVYTFKSVTAQAAGADAGDKATLTDSALDDILSDTADSVKLAGPSDLDYALIAKSFKQVTAYSRSGSVKDKNATTGAFDHLLATGTWEL